MTSAPKLAPLARRDTRSPLRRISRSELPVDTTRLAQYLIGKMIVHDLPQGRVSGRIVETEAYVVGDSACHAYVGMTPRNRTLFLERGHAYVYVAYGLHFLLNVSGERAGIGAGVLLRAMEPMEGIEIMEVYRGTKNILALARGPGRLAEALGVDRRQDGMDLCAPGELWLGQGVRSDVAIGTSVRIGITKDAHRLLRFYERGSSFVSGPRQLSP